MSLTQLRSVLRRYLPWIIFWSALAAIFVLMYVIVYQQKDLFTPDSRYYYTRALWFTGKSHQEAYEILASNYPADWGAVPDTQALFGWDLVRPRVVFSAFAAPFVAIFGLAGMAVASAITAVSFYAVTAWALARRYGRQVALAVTVLAMSSFYIFYFNMGMLTESMSALWSTLTVIFAAAYLKNPKRKWLFLMATTVVLAAFTRQAILIAAGAFAVAWLGALIRERRANNQLAMPALVVVGTSAIMQIIHLVAFPSFSQVTQYKRMTETETIGDAIRATPRLVLNILERDFVNFTKRDVVLLIIWALTAAGLVFCWKSVEAHLFIGAFMGIGIYQITNGNATQFRYAVPGLIFFLLVIARLFHEVRERISDHPLIELDYQADSPVATSLDEDANSSEDSEPEVELPELSSTNSPQVV